MFIFFSPNKHSLRACIFPTFKFVSQCVNVTYLFSPRELKDINSQRFYLLSADMIL